VKGVPVTNAQKLDHVKEQLKHARTRYTRQRKAFDEWHEQLLGPERAGREAASSQARAEVEKRASIVGEAAVEVNEHVRELHALQGAPPPGSVLAKERQLAREHPETHDPVRKVVARIMVANPRMYVTSTTGGKHAEHSYHTLGRAYDLGADSQEVKDACGGWCNQHVAGSLTEGIHNSNLSIKKGQHVAPSYWGQAEWQAHRNHVHIAV
jgi:hypothetical protein